MEVEAAPARLPRAGASHTHRSIVNAFSETRLQGLSTTQARERLERDGPNELPRTNRRTLPLGDRTEALVLTAFAGLSILITIVQEARSERVVEGDLLELGLVALTGIILLVVFEVTKGKAR